MKKLFCKLVSVISVICISGCSLNISIGNNDTKEPKSETVAPVVVEVPEGKAMNPKSQSVPQAKSSQNSSSQQGMGWTYETVIVTGHGAVNENLNGIRKNIHLNNIEEYVKGTIRPVYYAITDKFEKLERIESNAGITWYLGDAELSEGASTPIACIKYDAGTNGNKYERRYYFDSSNGELIFAFIFFGAEEHRLYFYKESIIRYIDNNGTIFDNPEQQYILDKGQNAITESRIMWY